MTENKKLRTALINTGVSPSQLMTVLHEYDQQENGIGTSPQNVNESGEMFNKIEYLMTELTRMMDNLENAQNNVTKDFVCHMSGSTNVNNTQ